MSSAGQWPRRQRPNAISRLFDKGPCHIRLTGEACPTRCSRGQATMFCRSTYHLWNHGIEWMDGWMGYTVRACMSLLQTSARTLTNGRGRQTLQGTSRRHLPNGMSPSPSLFYLHTPCTVCMYTHTHTPLHTPPLHTARICTLTAAHRCMLYCCHPWAWLGRARSAWCRSAVSW